MDKNMDMTEKVAYIKGMMEGMEFDTTTKEGKILTAVVEALGDVASKVAELDDEMDDVYDEVDAISEDLGDVESYLWEDDDEDDDDFDEDGMYEITCPNCGETVCVDEDMLSDDDLACPNCGTKFEVDFSEEDCDCDCESCGKKDDKE